MHLEYQRELSNEFSKGFSLFQTLGVPRETRRSGRNWKRGRIGLLSARSFAPHAVHREPGIGTGWKETQTIISLPSYSVYLLGLLTRRQSFGGVGEKCLIPFPPPRLVQPPSTTKPFSAFARKNATKRQLNCLHLLAWLPHSKVVFFFSCLFPCLLFARSNSPFGSHHACASRMRGILRCPKGK